MEILIMERFACHIQECGRVFISQADLETHQQRRHNQEKAVSFVESPEVLEYNPSDPLMKKLLRHVQTSEPQSKPAESLTEAYLLDFTGESYLEDITQLMLRDSNLAKFETGPDLDLERLECLESLSLSHNRIADLQGVGMCTALQDLNINNNAVRDLNPLSQLLQLKRLWASNNLIELVIPLENCRLLTDLALFGNKIQDLDVTLTSLEKLTKLEFLELERNPCTMRTSNARYTIVNRLRLKTLDGDDVTDLDYYIAKEYAEERPVPKNFVGKLRNAVQTQKKSEFDLLSHEIEELKERLEEVTQERDAFRAELRTKRDNSQEDLVEENKRLQREVANMYVLLDENIELRRQIDEGSSERARAIFAENMRLKARIAELEDTSSKKPAGLQRPKTAGVRQRAQLVEDEDEDDIGDDELTALMTRNYETLKSLRRELIPDRAI